MRIPGSAADDPRLRLHGIPPFPGRAPLINIIAGSPLLRRFRRAGLPAPSGPAAAPSTGRDDGRPVTDGRQLVHADVGAGPEHRLDIRRYVPQRGDLVPP